MKLKNVTRLMLYAFVIACILPSCVKEGPMGLPGVAGADGKDGKDANETCKVCHTATSVDRISTEFQFSKHEYGEAAFEEAGNTGCTPCHTQEAFKFMVKNNVTSTFTLNTTTGKYVNGYNAAPSSTLGEIGCSTCHSALHTTYGTADLAFTTVAPVAMTMWGGTKTIDLKADGGQSNLCVKCHQPRPFTNALTGNVLDYVALANTPGNVYVYDGNATGTTNIVRPTYRLHTHYGAVGAVYAGVGGVEFPGTLPYTSSVHTQGASCSDCHMGAIVGRAGGHTFNAVGKFDGCNTTGCHASSPITAASTLKWLNPRAEIKTLLNALAAKLTVGGVDILNRNGNTNEANGGVNLWAGLTTNNYDGYLNIYDPVTNPLMQFYQLNDKQIVNNPTSFKFNGTPPSTWSAAQIAYNSTLPPFPALTYTQMGALINFQLCLRDYSLGIHNFNYTKALLTNTIAKL